MAPIKSHVTQDEKEKRREEKCVDRVISICIVVKLSEISTKQALENESKKRRGEDQCFRCNDGFSSK